MQIGCIVAMYSFCWLLSECRVCCLKAYQPFTFPPTFARIFPRRLPFSPLLFQCFSTTMWLRQLSAGLKSKQTRPTCNFYSLAPGPVVQGYKSDYLSHVAYSNIEQLR